MRAMRAIERSDIVLMVLNAEEGIREQDKRVAGYAHEAGRGIIIVVNKWDTVKKIQIQCVILKRKFVMNSIFRLCTHYFCVCINQTTFKQTA